MVPLNIATPQNQPIDVVMPAFGQMSANVAGIQTVTAEFPPSWDYWELRFQLTNLTMAMIQEMRILVNGAIITRISGTVWDTINKYDKVPGFAGSASTVGYLTWYFRRLQIRGGAEALQGNPKGGYMLYSGSAKDQGLFSTLNCGSFDGKGYGIGAVRIEFDIVNTDAVNTPSIACKALASAPTPGGPGIVRRMEYQTPQVSAGNAYEASKGTLLFADVKHRLLNRLHLFPASGSLNNFVVRHNGIQKLQRTSDENVLVQTAEGLHADQTGNGLWTLDWSERGYGDETLPIGDPGTDLQIAFTPSATGNVNVYEDSMGSL